jgi:hypothetical protein
MFAGLSLDDFSEAVGINPRLSDQPAVPIDEIPFVLLNDAAIATKLVSTGLVRLRRLIVQMIALYFVRGIKSKAFPVLLSGPSSFRGRLRFWALLFQ